jgi:hypothetical protein
MYVYMYMYMCVYGVRESAFVCRHVRPMTHDLDLSSCVHALAAFNLRTLHSARCEHPCTQHQTNVQDIRACILDSTDPRRRRSSQHQSTDTASSARVPTLPHLLSRLFSPLACRAGSECADDDEPVRCATRCASASRRCSCCLPDARVLF